MIEDGKESCLVPDYLLLRLNLGLRSGQKIAELSLAHLLCNSISEVVGNSHITKVGYFLISVDFSRLS